MSNTPITLQQAQALVEAIKNNQSSQAQQILDEMTQLHQSTLFQNIESLTQNLHETLDELDHSDLLMQTKHDIPDAAERLQYVLQTTEQASNETLDTAEHALQKLEQVNKFVAAAPSSEAKSQTSLSLQQINKHLTDIMLAQSYQDLTGQVLNRVILIISSLEKSLIALIEQAGHDYHKIPARKLTQEQLKQADLQGVGPAMEAKTKDKDDKVDDLLDELGL